MIELKIPFRKVIGAERENYVVSFRIKKKNKISIVFLIGREIRE